ncbi:MAG: DUF1194 domain-containing protein [Thermodesulfobacteriota bacterium]
MLRAKITGLILVLALAAAVPAGAVPVALELALGIDVSGSVDASEYTLQKNGYINAFNNIAAFGPFSPFAVTYYEWSGASEQSQLVAWTLVTNTAEASAFAALIGGTSRAFSGLTAVGSAISYGAGLFNGNGFEGTRLVLDISGDGETNDGGSTTAARDAAAAAGITINGLPIGGASINAFYTNNVITAGGFTVPADSFADFQGAVFSKLQREITPPPSIPEPGTMLLMGIGAAGVTFMRRRKGAKA